mmetsp:Transcript_54665/g.122949  ORF Transcript_54665/g.122949 Transcript_54665/m.122949 type:complete len:198 (+) Transcript_54665:172-765(+)
MLSNTRSRTVFALQHKYSNEYVERSACSPLGCFEAQILNDRPGDTPIIKRKGSASRISCSEAREGASSSRALRSSRSCASLELNSRTQAPEEAEALWSPAQPGRLSSSGHLAGALRKSGLRKAGLLEDTRWPRPSGTTNVAVTALDVATPAVNLDCSLFQPLPMPGGNAAGDVLSPTSARQLLQAALAEAPEGDVLL